MNTAVMSQGGRVVVPREVRQRLGLTPGQQVIWKEVDGEVVLTTREAEIRRAQAYFGKLFADDPTRSLADELIAERRAEAAHEAAESDPTNPR